MWLQTLSEVCARFRFSIHAFCQMGNHYHILVETLDGNLAQGMRQLNGVYAQYFNRHHDLVGHLFQGRYKAILVDKESYLLELVRYILLNPVRAKLVAQPDEWLWSSFNHTLADATAPAWLQTNSLLSRFHADMPEARSAFRQFVLAGIGAASPLAQTFKQMVLGNEQFIQQLQLSAVTAASDGISKTQRGSLALSLKECQARYPDRDTAMAFAYRTHAYTLAQIARHFGVSHATTTRAVKKRS
jgi:REP element-mobilizing transposase RayT